MDGRQQHAGVAGNYQRHEWLWQRHGLFEREHEHDYANPRWDRDHRRSDVHGYAERRVMRVHRLSPTTMLAPFAGANGSATVTTSDGCAWTAATNTSWITVTSGAEGTTSGEVNFTVAPSTATSQRLGSLTIAGRTFAVTQAEHLQLRADACEPDDRRRGRHGQHYRWHCQRLSVDRNDQSIMDQR